MSSNRLSYDVCAYKAYLKQSVAPIDYSLDRSRFENCNKCRMELGVVGGTAVSHVAGNLVDLESDLRGQTRPVSQCPSYDYVPRDDNKIVNKNLYKCSKPVELDTTMKHLKPCQMIRYKPVAAEPPYQPASCQKTATTGMDVWGPAN